MPDPSAESRAVESLRDAERLLTLLHYETPFNPKPEVDDAFRQVAEDQERTRGVVSSLSVVLGATVSGAALTAWIKRHEGEQTDPAYRLIASSYLSQQGDQAHVRDRAIAASVAATNDLLEHADAWYVLKRFAYAVWQVCPAEVWMPLLRRRITVAEDTILRGN